uniref:AAA family ATPase n=1 Tax=Chryseobacterium endophyticum TaxID=1854762 RepID=A0AAU6WU69_9FLAO
MVSNLSDGTLRFLLQMAIYHNPNKGSLISLDEPEIGLHPDMISTICDSIIETSENTQYFIATHSPLILNGFRQEHILIFDKDENNHTVVKYLNKEKYEGIPLGQLWMSGNIGGVRW